MSERDTIMACIRRLNRREAEVLRRMTFRCGHQVLPRPYPRAKVRRWFSDRRTYLMYEYDKRDQ